MQNYAVFFLDLIKLFQEEKSTWEKCDVAQMETGEEFLMKILLAFFLCST